MFKIYIWIDGATFDADAFQNTAGLRLGGTVCSTKRMRNGAVELRDKIWQSRTIQIESGHPEEELYKLLIEMEEDVTRLAKAPTIRVVAEIVEYVSDQQSIRGFFFSKEIIHLMARMGIGLDIDIVPDLSDVDSSSSHS